MKKIEDYLYLYYGCEAYWQIDGRESTYHRPIDFDMLKDADWIKPLLRKLSDMTEEEAEHVVWLCVGDDSVPDEDRITKEEIGIDLIRPDGGLFVDEDAAIVMDLLCRCFEGQICVRLDGDIEIWDTDEGKHPYSVDNQTEIFRYLLSKGFDLFGLHEAGLCLYKNDSK